MKEIQKVIQKLSREQESAPAAAYEPVQKHKVTPSILGDLIKKYEWPYFRCMVLNRLFCIILL